MKIETNFSRMFKRDVESWDSVAPGKLFRDSEGKIGYFSFYQEIIWFNHGTIFVSDSSSVKFPIQYLESEETITLEN